MAGSNPNLTLAKLRSKLRLRCSLSLVCRELKRAGFTFKKTFYASEQRREDVRQEREHWRRRLKRIDPRRMVILDESGVRLGMRRSYAELSAINTNGPPRPIWPPHAARQAIPDEVPESLAEDFREAVAVLANSAKAIVALSRRCLQMLLRNHANVQHSSLAAEIDQVLPSLPPAHSQAIDAVRALGNIAAYPTKNKATGEVVAVELGEPEWLLEVLEALFDHYFVQRAELNRKKR